MPIFWLSFCDESQPKGEQFQGVCIVEAPDLIEAVRHAWRSGCNPGGQIASLTMPPDCPESVVMPRDTLMSKRELEEHFESREYKAVHKKFKGRRAI